MSRSTQIVAHPRCRRPKKREQTLNVSELAPDLNLRGFRVLKHS
jgi:hypothetical protein